ncbi:hypothetical protein SEVIR_1G225550v4 [Setaria viridis]
MGHHCDALRALLPVYQAITGLCAAACDNYLRQRPGDLPRSCWRLGARLHGRSGVPSAASTCRLTTRPVIYIPLHGRIASPVAGLICDSVLLEIVEEKEWYDLPKRSADILRQTLQDCEADARL